MTSAAGIHLIIRILLSTLTVLKVHSPEKVPRPFSIGIRGMPIHSTGTCQEIIRPLSVVA